MSALLRTEPNVVEGDFTFTESDFRRIAAMLREDSGIVLNETKAALVYSRLGKRLRRFGFTDFKDYCRLVGSPEGREERGAMLEALTTNLTRFFREPHHFDLLRKQVLEPMASAARAGARIRLWSAGCSTGEEPYSIALTVLQVLPEAARLDVRILATDIDSQVVARAQRGVYSDEAVAPIAATLRDRWMQRAEDDGGWSAGEDMRALIGFRTLNLHHDWPMRMKYNAIFCRNVVIYFDEPTQALLWPKFRAALAPGGRFYVGHSERVTDPAFVSDGLTAYKIGGEA